MASEEPTLAMRVQALEELRFLKVGLDLRHKDLEEARRRLLDTDRRLHQHLKSYLSRRTGLHEPPEELRALGRSGQYLSRSFEAQRSLLQRQNETLEQERFVRDVLQDETRRLRREARQVQLEHTDELSTGPPYS